MLSRKVNSLINFVTQFLQLRTPTFFLHYNSACNFQNSHGIILTKSYHKNEMLDYEGYY